MKFTTADKLGEMTENNTLKLLKNLRKKKWAQISMASLQCNCINEIEMKTRIGINKGKIRDRETTYYY